MKNKLGIISALVLSLAIAGSALAGVTPPKNNKTRPAAVAGEKTKHEKAKPKKHRKTKRAKTTKAAKTTAPSTKKKQ